MRIAVLCLLLVSSISFANEPIRRPFPVATGVGRAINRVIGFPFRTTAAALGFRAPIRARVRIVAQHQYVARQQFVAPVIARQQFVAPAQYVARQQFVAPVQYVARQQFVAPAQYIVARQQFYSQQDYTTPQVAQQIVAPQQVAQQVVTQYRVPLVTVQRIVSVQPEIQAEPTCQQQQITGGCAQQITGGSSQQITGGTCGAISQFRY